MAKILLVDDDLSLCGVVKEWLERQNYTIELVHKASEATEYLTTYCYDAVLLDWSLPDGAGVDVLQKFRKGGGKTPVLMLTGKNKIEEKEQGLDSGADDYLTKPFDMKELSARIRALLRRASNLPENQLTVADITLDPGSFTVTKGGEPLKMFPKDFALLEFFMRHPNKVYSAEALLNHVWSSMNGVGEETVRTSVKRLRKLIDTEGKPTLIENVFGVGYKLIPRD
jgi:DNA-binding response OmpR family regulator